MLVCLTAHQRTTALESLERLSVVSDEIAPRLAHAHDAIRGAVVLSTCNRFEAYFDLADGDGTTSPIPAMDAAMEQLADLSGLSFRDVRDTVDFAHGNRVARHLFSVAAGLDSVAVGEEEIAGQVRRALEAARRDGAATASLEHLFQRATETSRAVKNATRLSESGRSLVRLAVELAGAHIDDWSAARVLLVGSGRYAAASLAALRAMGARDIRVHSRSGRRRFADQEQLVVVDRAGYAAEAAAADVIVTCTTTNAAHALTAADHGAARAAAGAGAARRQIIIDLGMPRNVDPGVRALSGVELLDLETIRVQAPIDETVTVGEARRIVETAAQRHAAARRVQEVAPAVVALRAHVQRVLADELERAATPEAETALRHFSGVLLHGLISRGHSLASTGAGTAWVDAVQTVLPADPTADPSQEAP